MILSKAKQLAAEALGRHPPANREEQAYLRLADKGFVPDRIIDVGAYKGEWTRLTRRIFPAGPSLTCPPLAPSSAADSTSERGSQRGAGHKRNAKVSIVRDEGFSKAELRGDHLVASSNVVSN